MMQGSSVTMGRTMSFSSADKVLVDLDIAIVVVWYWFNIALAMLSLTASETS